MFRFGEISCNLFSNLNNIFESLIKSVGLLLVLVESNMTHLLIALENSLFLECFDT